MSGQCCGKYTEVRQGWLVLICSGTDVAGPPLLDQATQVQCCMHDCERGRKIYSTCHQGLHAKQEQIEIYKIFVLEAGVGKDRREKWTGILPDVSHEGTRLTGRGERQRSTREALALEPSLQVLPIHGRQFLPFQLTLDRGRGCPWKDGHRRKIVSVPIASRRQAGIHALVSSTPNDTNSFIYRGR